MEALIGALLDRVDGVAAAVGDRFPLYAQGEQWRTTARGSWAGGCWVGTLWLRAKLTGEVGAAEAWTRRLVRWTHEDTACRGLIFWYGAAGHRLGVTADHSVATDAAAALASSFDGREIPWGTALGPEPECRVDGAAGTVPLLAWAGHRTEALAHSRFHLARPTGVWDRGRAWHALVAADTAHWLGVRHESDTGGEFADTSAGAIAAVARLKLGLGADLLERVADRVRRGRLRGGVYSGQNDLETVWGNYFLLLGAAIALPLPEFDLHAGVEAVRQPLGQLLETRREHRL
ncbi:hypothetical protein, partial [Actinosynnema sp. NPDC020468]|uniref:hypothetical protein n=1 Tax=Actinosynnema sp. NPDC020468 TaxID=3154488 RepID=UPI0033D83473